MFCVCLAGWAHIFQVFSLWAAHIGLSLLQWHTVVRKTAHPQQNGRQEDHLVESFLPVRIINYSIGRHPPILPLLHETPRGSVAHHPGCTLAEPLVGYIRVAAAQQTMQNLFVLQITTTNDRCIIYGFRKSSEN